MKRTCIYILFSFLFLQMEAQNLSTGVNIRTAQFYLPGEGPYVEVYVAIAGTAIQYERNKKHLLEAGVEIQMLVLEQGKVHSYEKYELLSPPVVDTTDINFSLMDQRRLLIPDGTSTIEITVMDLRDSTNQYEYTEAMLSSVSPEVFVSEIQWVDTFKQSYKNTQFSKNNFELLPYAADFYPTSKNKVRFYGEVYNTDKYAADSALLITFGIRSASTDAHNPNFYQYTKSKAAPVVSFLREMDISDLPSGNFNLVIEVRNKQNELLAMKKQYFQRAKVGAVSTYDNIAMVNTNGTFVETYTDEQLNYFLEVIKPRANSADAKLIESLTPRVDPEMKKRFLYNFWVQRSLGDPYTEWKKYLELVTAVNSEFGTPSRPGYRTDRGRVYLQYGPPSDRLQAPNEPGAYPYEIWFYDTLPDKQTKIGFAFYDRTIATNDYKLLHSNARGELQDPRWKVVLYENVASPQQLYDLDNTNVPDKIGAMRPVDVYNF